MIAIPVLKICAVAGVALGALVAAPAGATSPDRSWGGVKKILVISQVANDINVPGIDAAALCARVQSIAATGSPVPVECTRVGDQSLRDPANAVLSFQASVTASVSPRPLLVFTIKRAAEAGLEPAPIYFGSNPRAVLLGSKDQSAAVNAAIRASLGEILPWLNANQEILRPEATRGE